jgi:hypothetical protein
MFASRTLRPELLKAEIAKNMPVHLVKDNQEICFIDAKARCTSKAAEERKTNHGSIPFLSVSEAWLRAIEAPTAIAPRNCQRTK